MKEIRSWLMILTIFFVSYAQKEWHIGRFFWTVIIASVFVVVASMAEKPSSEK